MKKYKIYVSMAVLSLGLYTSCDIERLPETSVTDSIFWNTVSDLRIAANYFYTTLPGLTTADIIVDTWSTDAYPNDRGNQISDGSRVAPATSSDYNYYGIFQANNLIEKSAEVLAKGGIESQVEWYVAEARFFRAWYYFDLLIRFGGVPLITETIKGMDDSNIFKERASRDDVLELIYNDLDYAIEKLRTADQLNAANEYGRIPKTGALAFKTRVALFEGTRSKYHGYGDYQKHLNLAKIAAEAVIASNDHAIYSTPSTGTNGETLNPAYFNLFQEVGEGRANKENIIVRAYGINRQVNIISTPVQRYYEGNNIVPTQNFVNHYLMADGLPISKSPLYKAPDATMTHAEYFNGKDPRMSFTIFKRGDEFISSGNYTKPNPSLQRSGFAIRKYAHKEFWNTQASFIDRPVLRYAEVLLNYAEVLFELNGAISDDDLNKTINQIRSRLPQTNIGTASAPEYVDFPKLTNAFVADHGLDMLTEIRRERKVELAFEGFAYWDLIRWKTAETELPKTLLGSYLFKEYLQDPLKWSENTEVDENNYIILQPSTLRKFDPEKDYLWPIPTSEIAKNPNVIKQNPKWE